MNLTISTNHIITVILIIIIIFSVSIFGIYKLIKIAVKKGTSEAMKESKKDEITGK